MFRSWLLRPVKRWLTLSIRIIMSQILDAANKISADIDLAIASNVASLAAKDAVIADLNAQLAALQASDADTSAAVVVLNAADAKIAPPSP